MATPKKPIEEHLPDGRPTNYRPVFNKQVYKLCLLRATDVEIADFFEVSVATITNWKQKHPKFLASIRAGKIQADADIVNSLYQNAKGYEYTETTYEKLNPGEMLSVGALGEIVQEGYKVKVVKKYMPPSDKAIQFWLKNRRPNDWRDKTEVDSRVEVVTYTVGFDKPLEITGEVVHLDEDKKAIEE